MQKIPVIGLRIIKTSISVVLCLLLAHWLKQPAPIYACIAAIIVTRENFKESFKQGISRILSTIVGCLFAMVVMSFGVENEYFYILMAGIGCMLTIYFCVLIKYPDTAALAAITYLLLVLTHFDDIYIHTIIRLAETIVGIILAIGVNTLFKAKAEKT
jgi:uncharacterized membrane protein YgaE (UPF0421/DUF939 family)